MNDNHPATFSVHIIEDADGNVRVISDWSGKGDRCLSLGIEIMQSLNAVSIFTDGGLSMGQAFSSSTEH